ncbi:MAG: EamA family transporter [Burkholderiaceae bacterium]
MKPADIFLTLAVVVIWGANFVVMKIGLDVLPPLLFTFLRFLLAAVPLVFFVRRPAVPLRLIAAYGITQFAIQFALLFGGMKLGMPAGLSSLVIQLQAFFTIGLAALMLAERPRAAQLVGAAIALAGMGLVAIHIESRTTLIGLAMVIAAGVSWAFGNIYTKRIALYAQASGVKVEALQIVAWGSLVAVPPLALLSLVVEGPALIHHALIAIDWRIAAAVLFNSYATTIFGFGAWSVLMRRYPTATVAPFTLLAPIVGMGSATLFLGETMHWWAIAAGLLVLAGLSINQFSTIRPASRSIPTR